MYIGIVLIAGVPNGFFMVMVTTVFFLIQYTLIISLEEETLDALFGNEYKEYKKNVPPIIPRLRPWVDAKKKRKTPILKTLKTEKRTLQNVFLILLLLFIKNSPTV